MGILMEWFTFKYYACQVVNLLYADSFQTGMPLKEAKMVNYQ